MKTNKKRIALSVLSVILVLGLLAGGTMAWFTDTEKVNANIEVNPDPNFTTTKPMEFKNLRPMLLENFEKELVAAGNVNNLENNGQDIDNYPAKNLPIYFRPVRIVNKGTLPTYVQLTMGAFTPNPNDKEPVLYDNDKYTITQGKYEDCKNSLEGALKLYVYRQDDKGNWVRVEGVNLNGKTLEKNPEDPTKDEVDSYGPNTAIKAGEEVTYIVAGYLPSGTDNEYQGQHYHGALTVKSRQADQGAYIPTKPGSGSGEVVDNTIEVKTVAKFTDHSGSGVVETGVAITLKLHKGITNATTADFEDQLRAFVASYAFAHGKTYEYTGVIPSYFTVVQDPETGEYSADLEGLGEMIVGVREVTA